jgi:hypothetical protein
VRDCGGHQAGPESGLPVREASVIVPMGDAMHSHQNVTVARLYFHGSWFSLKKPYHLITITHGEIRTRPSPDIWFI